MLGAVRCHDPRRDRARPFLGAPTFVDRARAGIDLAAAVAEIPDEHEQHHVASLSRGETKERKVPEIKIISVEGYLRALGLACQEAADEPRVRPLLFALLLLAPKTILELRRAARQLAA